MITTLGRLNERHMLRLVTSLRLAYPTISIRYCTKCASETCTHKS